MTASQPAISAVQLGDEPRRRALTRVPVLPGGHLRLERGTPRRETVLVDARRPSASRRTPAAGSRGRPSSHGTGSRPVRLSAPPDRGQASSVLPVQVTRPTPGPARRGARWLRWRSARPTLDDAAAVAALINAESRRLRGRDDVDADAVTRLVDAAAAVRPRRGRRARGPRTTRSSATAISAIRPTTEPSCGSTSAATARAEVHAELERRALERRAASGVVSAVADEKRRDYAGPARRARLRARSGPRTGWGSTSSAVSSRRAGRRARPFAPPWTASTSRCSTSSSSEALRGSLGLHADAVRGVGALAPGAGQSTTRRSGSSPRWTAPRPAPALGRPHHPGEPERGWISAARRPARPSQAAGSARRCSRMRSRSSSGEGSRAPASGWTPRARPAQSASTSGSG